MSSGKWLTVNFTSSTRELILNVIFKNIPGWYHGERITDGAQGWFPGNFTEEVNSAHVRARNLKERYRVLTFTASYIESQKKQK